ncbi:MAG: SPOR domain-containing protein, partial [Ignavibacteriaceae bacterium]
DGVPDYLDKCNNTPGNILIDETGCPIDLDKDGVPDYLDKCTNTPQNVLVDENGCAEGQNALDADTTTNQNKNLVEKNEILLVQDYDELNEKQVADMFFTDGELYCFQVSSFRDKNVADKEVKNLILDGHNAFVIEAYPFNNYQVWYRIRIGYFKTLEEAKVYKEEYFK